MTDALKISAAKPEHPEMLVDMDNPKLPKRPGYGEASKAIFLAALSIGDRLGKAFALAHPRLRALRIAAGPWSRHDFVSETWGRAVEHILAECLCDTVKPALAQGGRPNSPATTHHSCLIPTGGGDWLPAHISIRFDADRETAACVSRTEISLGKLVIQLADFAPEERDRLWQAKLNGIIAHEIAHVWQWHHWRPGRLGMGGSGLGETSVGGKETSASPHPIRSVESLSIPAGIAAFAATAGLPDDFTRWDLLPGDRALARLRDWGQPEFAAAHPAVAHRVRVVHRFYRFLLPIAREIIAPDPRPARNFLTLP